MADIVIEVHSITAAPIGWRIAKYEARRSGHRIACFALVTTTSAEHPGVTTGRRIIPVTEHEIGAGLIGMEVETGGPEVTLDGD